MIVPRHYENLSVLHENRMAARAYYIPASKRMDTLVERREDSDRVQMLNGKWKFCYFKSIYELKDEFYKVGYDVSAYDWLEVPGVWQTAGYDSNQYTNIRYPFPFDPPYIPQENPCGAYVHQFYYNKDSNAPKVFLNFEGVDSCFYVWINGIYIGYSQVSHSTSEFDISEVIMEGYNTLAVLVLKWCDGSYLEDQDKFRMSGIFRDVYLLKRPRQTIWDYFVQTNITKTTATISVKMQYFEDVVPTSLTLYDPNNKMVDTVVIENTDKAEKETILRKAEKVEKETVFGKAEKLKKELDRELKIADPILWNAENPYLYTLVIETEKETIVDYIGLREIRIVDKVVYLNGTKIKFRGVNRHEFDPVTGFTISLEQMKQDLMLMRQHNINAIRTSHYPDSPVFYQLCDKYGFMVIDEADIESHGPCEIFYKENNDANKFNRWNEPIADNPEWEKAILERVQLCVQRDKNRPCVLIWSMGNESAFGCNFEKALKWTKEFDPNRLTHYESARYRKKGKEYDFSNLDLYSRMYSGFDEIQEYLENDPVKPFLLCEYCHAMGNGPGDLEDYFEWFDRNDIMCGGFVWEWCDHAIAYGKTWEGKTIYYYGGDHGEKIHDGNFCMDGLVYPDRTPHTGLLEYKNVYRPARVCGFDQNTQKLIMKNYMEFTDLESYIDIAYEVNCDGVVLETGKIPAFSVKPKQMASVILHIGVPKSGRAYLKLYYYMKKETEFVPAGHLLGFDEIPLKTEDNRNQISLKWLKPERDAATSIQIQETEDKIFCSGKGFAYTYDKCTGMFTQINYGGVEYLDRPMELNIWRAPTDNDRNIKSEWKRAQYDQAYTRAYHTKVKQMVSDDIRNKQERTEDTEEQAVSDRSVRLAVTSDDTITEQKLSSVKICSVLSVLAASVQRILDVEVTWIIDGNGGICLEADVKRNMEFPVLPRFGIRLFLNRKLEQISYYGMGPFESYPDKHMASSHGLYHTSVLNLHEDYIRPQENGSHMDCDYVTAENEQFGLTAVSERKFSFQASVYTQEELEEKKHYFELEPSGSVVLCLDYRQNGIGSNSCGPELLNQYQLNKETFSFIIKMVPFMNQ